MQPRFETLNEKKFAGKKLRMSFADNKTFEIWQSFMPRKNEIKNAIGGELYSIEIYPEDFFKTFSPIAEFEKWAAVEVENFENLPDEIKTLASPKGLYAVFTYKGKSSEVAKFYQNIFQDWLPNAKFSIDVRPHLAVMGEKYKNDSDDSEEEFWIPVKPKIYQS